MPHGWGNPACRVCGHARQPCTPPGGSWAWKQGGVRAISLYATQGNDVRLQALARESPLTHQLAEALPGPKRLRVRPHILAALLSLLRHIYEPVSE